MPSLDSLQSLDTLVIKDNKINFSEIVESVKMLKNLSVLKLDNLNCDLDLIKPSNIPASLKILDLVNFKQNTFPFDLNDSKLESIKCSGVKLISISSTSSNEALNSSKVIQFYGKLFTHEQINEIFRLIHGSKTEYLNSTEALKFNAYIYRKFPRFGYGETVIESNNDSMSSFKVR